MAGWLTAAAWGVDRYTVESPGFLFSVKRRDEAADALRHIAAANGVPHEASERAITAASRTSVSDGDGERDASGVEPLRFWQKEWQRRNVCVGVAFFASAASWFALNLSAGSLSPSALLNLVLLTLIDLPAYRVAGDTPFAYIPFTPLFRSPGCVLLLVRGQPRGTPRATLDIPPGLYRSRLFSSNLT